MLRLSALVVGCLLLAAPASAGERAFAKRFGETTRGDIRIAGNVLHDCDIDDTGGTGGTCAQARAGDAPGFHNNDHHMLQADVDADPTTFNSSRATLDLPTGAQVRFAGLYWGAATIPSVGGATPDATKRDTVRFDDPAPGGYVPVVSTEVDDLPAAGNGDYVAFADVTNRVAAAGEGDYMVADVQSATGTNTYAGWALVVAYAEPGEPLRNLTVFDGYRFMCDCLPGASFITQTLSGFRTPSVGPVLSRVGVIGYEGEVTPGAAVEGVEIDDTAVSGGSLNPAGDFFNGTVTAFGAHVTTKEPNNVLQMSSLDADLIESSGLMPPNATSAKLDLVASNLDGWYAQVLTFATEVEQPLLTLTKSVSDLNGAPARAGDVLEYTVATRNDGNDDADLATVSDAVPADAAFHSGSITVNGLAVTDGTDADAGDMTGGVVNGQLGTITPGQTKTVTFRVTIPGATATGTEIVNAATASYAIPAGPTLQAASNSVTTTVAAPLPVATPSPSPSPTAAPTALPALTPIPTPVPVVAVPPSFAKSVVLPSTRKCVSRRVFKIRLRQPKGDPIKDATVSVNGKRVKVIRSDRVRAGVDLRGLPKGRFTVKIVIRTVSGRTIKGSRKYRTCVANPKKRRSA